MPRSTINVVSILQLLIRSFTHPSFIHSLYSSSLSHTLIHSIFVRLLPNSYCCSSSFIVLCIHLLVNYCIRSFVRSFVSSCTHRFVLTLLISVFLLFSYLLLLVLFVIYRRILHASRHMQSCIVIFFFACLKQTLTCHLT